MNIEKKLEFIEQYKKAKNAASGSKFDANSNVTDKSIATLASELPKKDNIDLQRAVMQQYITKLYGEELSDQYIADMNHHIIYRHDESGGAGGFPYCASITLYPFLLNGLKTLGGNSEPPKHTDSFIGGFINLIFLVAGQFIGAIAAPETLTYMDYFLRKDYGEDYTDLLDNVVEFRKSKQRTLRDRIEDWFAQLVYTLNQPAAARGNQSVFFNIAYFDEPYFNSIFENFVFPDGGEPKWETTKVLQQLFMKWFNKERTKTVLTFPVETMNMLVDKKTGQYVDKEMADFAAQMWAEGASFFMYQSDSVDSLSSCCRLRNGIEENVFSYTLGAGGIETGSKAVITMNVNRIVQDWHNNEKDRLPLNKYIEEITDRIHKYLSAFNQKLWDDFDAGLLPVFKAGFINLDKQYLTVGVNGFVEAAEFLGINIDPSDPEYRKLARDVLGTIENTNTKNRTKKTRFNLEFVPAENLAVKNYNWDKEDGYVVPSGRNLYNSYFYIVEDDVDPVKKFEYQGEGFADVCSGGVALHNNLDDHLSKDQYRMLMDVAVESGCNYFTYNIPNTVCEDCGHITKEHLRNCPKCGSSNTTYLTRVIGYLKKVSNFSEARQEEANRRFYGDVNETELEEKLGVESW